MLTFEQLQKEQEATFYDHERHVAICEALEDKKHLPKTFMLLPPKVTASEESYVWDNIVFMRSLNASQVRQGAATHLCPLPLDITDRVVRLYSNPGDIVLDPFSGLGTVLVSAVTLGRFGYGVELAEDYYLASVGYLEAAEQKVATPSLFALIRASQGDDNV